MFNGTFLSHSIAMTTDFQFIPFHFASFRWSFVQCSAVTFFKNSLERRSLAVTVRIATHAHTRVYTHTHTHMNKLKKTVDIHSFR